MCFDTGRELSFRRADVYGEDASSVLRLVFTINWFVPGAKQVVLLWGAALSSGDLEIIINNFCVKPVILQRYGTEELN